MIAIPKAQPADAVAAQSDWPAILRNTIVEVFLMMVGVAVLTPETGDHMVLSESRAWLELPVLSVPP